MVSNKILLKSQLTMAGISACKTTNILLKPNLFIYYTLLLYKSWIPKQEDAHNSDTCTFHNAYNNDTYKVRNIMLHGRQL